MKISASVQPPYSHYRVRKEAVRQREGEKGEGEDRFADRLKRSSRLNRFVTAGQEGGIRKLCYELREKGKEKKEARQVYHPYAIERYDLGFYS